MDIAKIYNEFCRTRAFDIKNALRGVGYTVIMIAKDLGVSQPLVSRTITGKEENKRVQDYITKLTGKDFF